MIEKLHKLKYSPFLTENILEIARQELLNFSNEYSMKTIRAALESQGQNIHCQDWVAESILDILDECPEVKKDLKTLNDKYDLNLEENEQMPSLHIHKYVKPFNRKLSHQILR